MEGFAEIQTVNKISCITVQYVDTLYYMNDSCVVGLYYMNAIQISRVSDILYYQTVPIFGYKNRETTGGNYTITSLNVGILGSQKMGLKSCIIAMKELIKVQPKKINYRMM